jgi:chromosome segregation ATPase
MKESVRTFLLIILFSAFLVPPFLASSHSFVSIDSLEDCEHEFKALNERLEESESKVKTLEMEVSTLESGIKILELEIESLKRIDLIESIGKE